MNVATQAAVLRERARLHAHDGWTRAELVAYQAQRLSELREEDVLTLGGVSVHPNVFHRVLETLPLAAGR